ncbi:DUF3052 domain-containing protein [Ornithinimicrobium cerasi]|uniref:DUF3052 domain-containing protein n=1 Tax=Ornithinimicrobium cerasi TaxID=2248773 RepID=UPI000EFE0586|nr:DUF3052 domain-containing protein [Ornithinimicrobium cerasi]
MATENDTVDPSDAGPLGVPLRKMGVAPGQIVIEYGYDDDVDEDVRAAIETLAEGPLEDEDYDGVVDVVLLWWREGDGDLADELMDSLTTMEEGGFIALLTPGVRRPDRVAAHDVQEACATCSLTASGAVPLGEWVGQRLVGRK